MANVYAVSKNGKFVKSPSSKRKACKLKRKLGCGATVTSRKIKRMGFSAQKKVNCKRKTARKKKSFFSF